jgi:hypothetical protein
MISAESLPTDADFAQARELLQDLRASTQYGNSAVDRVASALANARANDAAPKRPKTSHKVSESSRMILERTSQRFAQCLQNLARK